MSISSISSAITPSYAQKDLRLAQFFEMPGPGSTKPGSSQDVRPHLSDDELGLLFRKLNKPEPALKNYMIDEGRSFSGAALIMYAQGKGGLVKLPSEFASSKNYYVEPSSANTTVLLDRVFGEESATPGVRGILAKMKALKVGESITFRDNNNKLINIRDKQVGGISTESPAETDRMMTLGNATFNTNATVTLTKQQDGSVNVQANLVHVILDRYDWNAKAADSAASAARATILPDGIGGYITANHQDWMAMKKLGAKDFAVGFVASETRTYNIPADAIKDLHFLGNHGVMPWRSGNLDKYATSVTKPVITTDPTQFRTQLRRASAQNKNSVVIPQSSYRQLESLKYTTGIKDLIRPPSQSKPGQIVP